VSDHGTIPFFFALTLNSAVRDRAEAVPLLICRGYSGAYRYGGARRYQRCFKGETVRLAAVPIQPLHNRFTWLYQCCNTVHDKTMTPLRAGRSGERAVKKMDTTGAKKPEPDGRA
jgi:hypothetical protein